MKATVLFLFFLTCSTVLAQQPPRVMLAVFAHPDDETWVAPVLARYAREGAKVYLAIATKGEKGTSDRAGIAPGEPLATVRHKEAICACRQIGIEPPIFFGLNDGELGAMTSPLGRNTHEVAAQVDKLIAELHPTVVITWGADGGYGHPDHRLVSNAVTQVVQSSKSNVKLVYIGFSPAQVKLMNEHWHPALPWHPTKPAYLTVRIAFTKVDQLAFHRALQCHQSQFSSEEMSNLANALDSGWQQGVLFRPWFGDYKSDDLFK